MSEYVASVFSEVPNLASREQKGELSPQSPGREVRPDLWEEGTYLLPVPGSSGNVSEGCGLLALLVNTMPCLAGCVCGKHTIWIRETATPRDTPNIAGPS